MSTPSKPFVSVFSRLASALAALVGYAPSMREELEGELL